ncbi:MAG: AsmA family protein [Gammaproteobacteria bacterium]|nr:AsmA family protein [Gammaproteobacteria bacterium]
MSPQLLRVLRATAIVLGALLLLIVLVLALFPWNRLKHPIERMASAQLGRPVRIEGPLRAHVWSFNPTFDAEGLTVADPPWEERPLLLRVERLQVQLQLLSLLRSNLVLPRVMILRPDLYLHRERSGRVNWSFENQAPTNERNKKPAKLPVVRDLLIEGGKLDIADDIRRLKVQGSIDARQQGSQENPQALRIAGQGTLNREPFAMQVTGGPIMNLQPGDPYPFDLHISAGDVRLEAGGKLRRPFDLADLLLTFNVRGRDLADLFYLTQVTLPNTPPYSLRFDLDRKGNTVKLSNIAGTLGESDITGAVDLDFSRKRPNARGKLTSKRLRMRDFVASVGAPTGKPSTLQPQKSPPPPKARDPNARLFPDSRLQVDRVRAMDADVQYEAGSVELGTLPMRQLAMHIKLNEGVLGLAPVRFTLEQGRVEADAQIDARQDVPLVKLDLRLRDLKLDQFKGKAPNATPPLSGVLQARTRIEGRGDSVHRVLANGNGTLTAVLPGGEVNAAFAELTGIDIAKGLGLLMSKSDAREPLRCGLTQFDIRQGDMQVQTFVIDAQDVRITGKGDIRLGPEQLNLEIRGQPKKLRLTRLRTPIELRGHLLDPHVGIDVGATAKQGAVAVALGAVTPLAALIAFIDPGLAKDENCAALLGAPAPQPAAPASPH